MDETRGGVTKQNACDVSCFPVKTSLDITVRRIHSCFIDPRRSVCEPYRPDMNASVVAEKFTPTMRVRARL